MKNKDLKAAAEQNIERLTTELLRLIGEDPAREGLLHTPRRVARSWSELTAGYRKNLTDVVHGALFHEDGAGKKDMIVTRSIRFYSLCEHHLLPFYGRAVVAYIPNKITIGLSKIPRIVDMYARRLQLQERLTHQIADAVEQTLAPRGVAVFMEADHLCVMMRGVKKEQAQTVTTCFCGEFKTNIELQNQFLLHCLKGGRRAKS